MSLGKLMQIGWYKAEPSSSKEIADLFSIVDRSQADLKVGGISDDHRYQAAYNDVLTLANIALRASGFRVSQNQAHRQRIVENLELTVRRQMCIPPASAISKAFGDVFARQYCAMEDQVDWEGSGQGSLTALDWGK
jgi:hypothetical protein